MPTNAQRIAALEQQVAGLAVLLEKYRGQSARLRSLEEIWFEATGWKPAAQRVAPGPSRARRRAPAGGQRERVMKAALIILVLTTVAPAHVGVRILGCPFQVPAGCLILAAVVLAAVVIARLAVRAVRRFRSSPWLRMAGGPL